MALCWLLFLCVMSAVNLQNKLELWNLVDRQEGKCKRMIRIIFDKMCLYEEDGFLRLISVNLWYCRIINELSLALAPLANRPTTIDSPPTIVFVNGKLQSTAKKKSFELETKNNNNIFILNATHGCCGFEFGIVQSTSITFLYSYFVSLARSYMSHTRASAKCQRTFWISFCVKLDWLKDKCP